MEKMKGLAWFFGTIAVIWILIAAAVGWIMLVCHLVGIPPKIPPISKEDLAGMIAVSPFFGLIGLGFHGLERRWRR
jgi:hypothetical protein